MTKRITGSRQILAPQLVHVYLHQIMQAQLAPGNSVTTGYGTVNKRPNRTSPTTRNRCDNFFSGSQSPIEDNDADHQYRH